MHDHFIKRGDNGTKFHSVFHSLIKYLMDASPVPCYNIYTSETFYAFFSTKEDAV